MKCLYPNQCGIGMDCKECYQLEIQRLQSELDAAKKRVKVLEEALQSIIEKENRRMYETCPDCYSDSLGCERNKICKQFTGSGLLTPTQRLAKQALEDNSNES